MWKLLSALSCSAALCLLLVFTSGCSLDETEDNVHTVQQGVNAITPYVPISHTYIPAGISALCTAALTIIKIVKERRNANRMKEAIKAKGRQIDKILAVPPNPDPGKENPIKTFMRADKSKADNKTFNALADFDGVRKGYI